jgi:hypothetical protein
MWKITVIKLPYTGKYPVLVAFRGTALECNALEVLTKFIWSTVFLWGFMNR